MTAPAPAKKKKKAPKYRGTTFIDEELCKGCAFCIEFCPPDVLEFSKEFNPKGYHYPVLVREEECTGCDLCGLYCPDFAIFAVRFHNPAHEGKKADEK